MESKAVRRPWMALPRGHPLREPVWRRRHRFMLGVVAAHVIVLPAFGVYMGHRLAHSLLEGAVVAALLAFALVARSRTAQATFAALALVASSGILVHFSGGYIEAHFHFFVVLAFITMYQDWVPFAATIAAIILHHGVVGALEPTAVYNHAGALADPWRWALIHGLFVFAACSAYVFQWRLNEDARDEADVVLHAAGEPIVGVDGARRITFANPAARRLFKARSLEGRPVEGLLESCTGLTMARRHLEETRLRGRALSVEVVSSPIVQRGKVSGHVLTIVDIQERRLAERERMRNRDEQLQRLRELDELKSSFINSVAHELRTPMTPLRLQAGLLRRLERAEDKERAVEMLDRNLVRLHRLMDDVLDVTQVQAGKVILRLEEVELKPIVDGAVADCQQLAVAHGTKLAAYCPAGLRLQADIERLAQIIHNLVAHAIQCAPGGHVSVAVEGGAGMANIRVRDDGVGLSDQDLGRLFQPFASLQHGEQRRGTGLGLYLASELARLHHGRIMAASRGPGRGAVFTVTLPLAAAGIHAPLLVR